jgi:hypothetical protein
MLKRGWHIPITAAPERDDMIANLEARCTLFVPNAT